MTIFLCPAPWFIKSIVLESMHPAHIVDFVGVDSPSMPWMECNVIRVSYMDVSDQFEISLLRDYSLLIFDGLISPQVCISIIVSGSEQCAKRRTSNNNLVVLL